MLYFQLGHIWYKVRVGTIGIITYITAYIAKKVIFGLKMLVFTNGFAGLFVNSFTICLTKHCNVFLYSIADCKMSQLAGQLGPIMLVIIM